MFLKRMKYKLKKKESLKKVKRAMKSNNKD